MDLINNLALGFSVALLPINLLFCLLGVFLGTVIGVLPGIGPLATISMLLPLTFGLPPTTSLIMLSGIYYGSQYGGSTTAILVNLPGEASSTVTMIDGYQMALRGRAGPALAAAGIGSFFAGSVATVFVALIAIPLTSIALSFRAGGVFLADDSRPRVVDRARVRLRGQGDRHDLPRTAARPDRHRHLHQPDALHLRRQRPARRHRLRRHGGRRVRYRRNPAQPRKLDGTQDHHRQGHRPVAEQGRPAPHGRADPARHRDRLRARHPARRRRAAVVFRHLQRREEDIEEQRRIRQGRDRRRRRAGVRQQRRRADLLHPDADARPSLDACHGADDRRDDHSGHHARPQRHHQQSRPVLGPDRLDVDRQCDADHSQPAADRHLGAASCAFPTTSCSRRSSRSAASASTACRVRPSASI